MRQMTLEQARLTRLYKPPRNPPAREATCLRFSAGSFLGLDGVRCSEPDLSDDTVRGIIHASDIEEGAKEEDRILAKNVRFVRSASIDEGHDYVVADCTRVLRKIEGLPLNKKPRVVLVCMHTQPNYALHANDIPKKFFDLFQLKEKDAPGYTISPVRFYTGFSDERKAPMFLITAAEAMFSNLLNRMAGLNLNPYEQFRDAYRIARRDSDIGEIHRSVVYRILRLDDDAPRSSRIATAYAKAATDQRSRLGRTG
jgi:hypothetical protein